MKFKINEKFNIKGCDLNVDIVSLQPGAQGVKLDMGTENVYGVNINGFKTFISESMLNLLLESAKKEDEKPYEPSKAEKSLPKEEKKSFFKGGGLQ